MKKISASILGLGMYASAVIAEPVTIGWSTLDGGGGTTAGGSFALNGTMGQPDAGTMGGSAFTISGGFWPGVAVSLQPPRLAIRLAGAGSVILSWLNPSAGYVLQQTTDLTAPNGGWTDVTQQPVIVGPNKEVTLPLTGQARFFRLRRP